MASYDVYQQQQQVYDSQGNLIKGSYGGLPVAEKNQSYFVYTNGAGGTGPEIIGQTAVFCTYLIDDQGNIFQSNQNSTARFNIIQNFEIGKKVNLKMEQPSVDYSQLNGQHTITGVGTIQPILLTETGSTPSSYLPTMSFSVGVNVPAVDDYRFEAKKSSTQTVGPLDFPAITFTNTIYDFTAGNWDGSDQYIFTNPANTIDGGTRVKFKVYIRGKTSSGFGGAGSVTFYIFEDQNNEYLTQTSTYFPSDGTIVELTFETPFLNFEDNDDIKILVNGVDSGGQLDILAGSSVTAIQEYEPNNFEVTSSYWEIGDYNASATIITASNQLTGVYGGGFVQSYTTDLQDWGFNPIKVKFEDIKIGDRIRFEYNEDKRFNVAEIIEDGPNGRLCLKLDGQVPTGSELNHFILYRLADDGAYVILDVDKDIVGTTGGGIMTPQFLSTDLNNNFDQILDKLKERNILQNDLSFNDETT